MKKFFLAFNLVLTLLFLSTSALFANTNNFDNLFENANKLYKNGEFKSALDIYLKLSQENENPEILFNIGNCYFREKDYAKAILFYEKTKLITPNDLELEQNILLTQSKLLDKIETLPQFQLIEYLANIRDLFNSNAWSILTITTACLSAILFFLFYLASQIRIRQLSFFGFIVFLIIFSFNFSMTFWRNQYEIAKDNAIITSSSVYIKSSPNDSSQNLFLVHSGAKVKLFEENGDFVKIKLLDGRPGWLNKKDIEII